MVAMCHSRACVVGCMDKIFHTNLKTRIVISEIATSKNHIEFLVPCLNCGLDSTFGKIETEIFWVMARGA